MPCGCEPPQGGSLFRARQQAPKTARVWWKQDFNRQFIPQVTHTALATPEVLDRLCLSQHASPFQRFIRDLLLFFASTYKARHKKACVVTR